MTLRWSRAEVGEFVTCENGHYICRIAAPVVAGEWISDMTAYFDHWIQPAPPIGSLEDDPGVRCARCGGRFWRNNNILHVLGRGWMIDEATNWEERATRAESALARATEALRFYANPKLYEPHPHGSAFDGRDKSYLALDVLASISSEPKGEGETDQGGPLLAPVQWLPAARFAKPAASSPSGEDREVASHLAYMADAVEAMLEATEVEAGDEVVDAPVSEHHRASLTAAVAAARALLARRP